jgi:hypothetical protein
MGLIGGFIMNEEKVLIISEDVIEDCLCECLEK